MEPAPRPTGELPVFVYGTMLRGEANHGLMTGARFVRATRTRAEFELHDLGGFPGLVAGGATQVDGELYLISPEGLRQLDELEDHPQFYRRSRVRLEDDSEAFVYLLPAAHGAPYPRIPSGDWRQRQDLRRVD